MKNARLRLDDTGFDDEIGIMGNYIQILGNLFHEIILEMRNKVAGTIAVAGFTMKSEKQP